MNVVSPKHFPPLSLVDQICGREVRGLQTLEHKHTSIIAARMHKWSTRSDTFTAFHAL